MSSPTPTGLEQGSAGLRSRATKRVLEALLVLECAGIAWLTLTPSAGVPSGAVGGLADLVDLLGGPAWLADPAWWEFALNVVLFVPLTLIGALRWPRVGVGAWILVGLVVSGAVELTQLTLLPHRTASLLDVVSNTSGAILGALAARVVSSFSARR